MHPVPDGTIVIAKENPFVVTGRLGIIQDSHPTQSGRIDYEVLSEQGGRIYLYEDQLQVVAPPIQLEIGMKVRFFHNFWFQVATVMNFSDTHNSVGLIYDGRFLTKHKLMIAPAQLPANMNNIAGIILERGD